MIKINILKKQRDFKKKEFDLNPLLYWRIALAAAFIIIIFTFFESYRLFMKINREPSVAAGEQSAQVPSLSRERIDKVLQYFSERERKSQAILNSPVPIVDPSQ